MHLLIGESFLKTKNGLHWLFVKLSLKVVIAGFCPLKTPYAAYDSFGENCSFSTLSDKIMFIICT